MGYDNVALGGISATFCVMCPHQKCLNCATSTKCGNCETNYMADPDNGFCCFAYGCKTCKTFQLTKDDGESCAICKVGYWLNSTNYCNDCHTTCEGCNGPDINNCISCTAPLVLRDNYCCHATCFGCTGPAENQCTKCTGSLSFYNNKCISDCPQGYFSLNNVCEKCDGSCLECNGFTANDCIQCDNPNYLKVAPKGACVADCGNYYYPYVNGADRLCESCHSSCLTCDNSADADKCTSCESPRNQNSTTSTFYCCDQTCKTCSGPDSDQCLSCSDPLFFYPNTCKKDCPLDYFGKKPEQVCKECHENCSKCLDDIIDQCIDCKEPYYLLENLIDKCTNCIPGMYGDTTGSQRICKDCSDHCETCSVGSNANQCDTCTAPTHLNKNIAPDYCCHQDCLECDGVTSKDCTKCSSPTYLHFKECINKCPTEHYYPQELPERKCLPCDTNCLECDGPSSSECTKCDSPKYLHQKQCIPKCPSDHYHQLTPTRECKECDSSCKACIGPSKNDCTDCEDPNFVYEVLPWTDSSQPVGPCQICPSKKYYGEADSNNDSIPGPRWCFSCLVDGCHICEFGNENVCKQCDDQYYSLIGKCYWQCPQGYYGNTTNYVCESCAIVHCEDCYTNKYGCEMCKSPYVLFQNQCLGKCPAGTWLDTSTRKCIECSISLSNCAECSSVDECTLCENNSFLNKGTKTCEYCGDGFYANQIKYQCEPCHETCYSCFQTTESSCIKCNEPFYYNEGYCLEECPSNKFPTKEGQCQVCHSSCKTCNGANNNNCLTCYSEQYYHKSQCLDNCPSGYYNDYEKNPKTCSSCHSSCKTCNGHLKNNCLSCQDNYYFENNECLPKIQIIPIIEAIENPYSFIISFNEHWDLLFNQLLDSTSYNIDINTLTVDEYQSDFTQKDSGNYSLVITYIENTTLPDQSQLKFIFCNYKLLEEKSEYKYYLDPTEVIINLTKIDQIVNCSEGEYYSNTTQKCEKSSNNINALLKQTENESQLLLLLKGSIPEKFSNNLEYYISKITVQGQSKFTYRVIPTSSKKQFYIEFNFTENIVGKPLVTIYFDISNDEELLSQMNLVDKEIEENLLYFEKLTKDEEDIIESQKKQTEYTSNFVQVALLASCGGGFGLNFQLFILLDLIALLQYQAIEFPKNALDAILAIENMPPKFIMKNNLFTEKFEVIKKFPSNYYIRELSPYYLNNAFEYFLQYSLAWVICIFMFCCYNLLRRLKVKETRIFLLIINTCQKIFIWTLAYIFFFSNLVDIIFSICVAVFMFNLDSSTSYQLNGLTAIFSVFILLVFLFAFGITIYIITHKNKFQQNFEKIQEIEKNSESGLAKSFRQKKGNSFSQKISRFFQYLYFLYSPKTSQNFEWFKEKHGFLVNGFKQTNNIFPYSMLIDVGRVFLLTLFCSYTHLSVQTSIIMMTTFQFFYFLYVITQRPWNSQMQNIFGILFEFLIFICYTISCYFMFQDKKNNYDFEKRKFLGELIAYAILVLMYLSIIQLAFDIISELYSYIKNRRKYRKVQNKSLEQDEINPLKSNLDSKEKYPRIQDFDLQQKNSNKLLGSYQELENVQLTDKINTPKQIDLGQGTTITGNLINFQNQKNINQEQTLSDNLMTEIVSQDQPKALKDFNQIVIKKTKKQPLFQYTNKQQKKQGEAPNKQNSIQLATFENNDLIDNPTTDLNEETLRQVPSIASNIKNDVFNLYQSPSLQTNIKDFEAKSVPKTPKKKVLNLLDEQSCNPLIISNQKVKKNEEKLSIDGDKQNNEIKQINKIESDQKLEEAGLSNPLINFKNSSVKKKIKKQNYIFDTTPKDNQEKISNTNHQTNVALPDESKNSIIKIKKKTQNIESSQTNTESNLQNSQFSAKIQKKKKKLPEQNLENKFNVEDFQSSNSLKSSDNNELDEIKPEENSNQLEQENKEQFNNSIKVVKKKKKKKN